MLSDFITYKCMLIANEGSSLKEDYSILGGNPIVDYYESVMSPSISLTITFVDVDQVINRKGITGGESLDLSIKISGFDDFKITSKKHNLILNSVRDVITDTSKQIATLEFVSMDSIINETCRVNKKFTGPVTQIVEQLLTKKGGSDKKGIQTKKELKSDKVLTNTPLLEI